MKRKDPPNENVVKTHVRNRDGAGNKRLAGWAS